MRIADLTQENREQIDRVVAEDLQLDEDYMVLVEDYGSPLDFTRDKLADFDRGREQWRERGQSRRRLARLSGRASD
ncbi:MAG: hypothetical protein OXQ89_05045 [Rhodospirillaceae bacterium]|nr:hypothetical protein [Rhodospirillaceae bacterium]MDE0359547.1 hypothetical protein [Rhodospirillaceae bacterium]